ncbi:MAG: glycosyltransferase family 2 protein, partial [Actinobacteria bacterium]|nr:glycosyltransferase family 2 protein [Actinomycetota bacterium]
MLSVSVVIPTHNSSATIERAVNSVLAQDLLPTELVIVDDCSTDNTVELVRTIAIPDSIDVKVVRLDTNLGPSAARNAGWNVAGGEFIAFLDSDDSWQKMGGHRRGRHLRCSRGRRCGREVPASGTRRTFLLQQLPR